MLGEIHEETGNSQCRRSISPLFESNYETDGDLLVGIYTTVAGIEEDCGNDISGSELQRKRDELRELGLIDEAIAIFRTTSNDTPLYCSPL